MESLYDIYDKFNILILGNVSAGKSTLLNSLFLQSYAD
jgi:predicted GTPase